MAGGPKTAAAKPCLRPDMARPSKFELVTKFFPDLAKGGTKADRDQSIAYNTLACEVVLADQIRLYDKGLHRYGPGVLTVRLQDGAQESSYLPLEDLQHDRDLAAQHGHDDIGKLLCDVISQVETINPERFALLLLIDNTSAQLFPIEREHPARSVQVLLEEMAA